jgi:hypothetical protein
MERIGFNLKNSIAFASIASSFATTILHSSSVYILNYRLLLSDLIQSISYYTSAHCSHLGSLTTSSTKCAIGSCCLSLSHCDSNSSRCYHHTSTYPPFLVTTSKIVFISILVRQHNEDGVLSSIIHLACGLVCFVYQWVGPPFHSSLCSTMASHEAIRSPDTKLLIWSQQQACITINAIHKVYSITIKQAKLE